MPGASRAHDHNLANIIHISLDYPTNGWVQGDFGVVFVGCFCTAGDFAGRILASSAGTVVFASNTPRYCARMDDADTNSGSYALWSGGGPSAEPGHRVN